jgi:hypothetical protein
LCYHEFPFATYFLEASTLNNLVQITVLLRGNYLKYEQDLNTISVKSVVEKLRAAPNLRSLELNGFEINLTDMETLHSNDYQLEQLKLINVCN